MVNQALFAEMSNEEYYRDIANKRKWEVLKGPKGQMSINPRSQIREQWARATHHHHPRELIHSALSVGSFTREPFVMQGWEHASIVATRAIWSRTVPNLIGHKLWLLPLWHHPNLFRDLLLLLEGISFNKGEYSHLYLETYKLPHLWSQVYLPSIHILLMYW